jgi:hypothetical protein
VTLFWLPHSFNTFLSSSSSPLPPMSILNNNATRIVARIMSGSNKSELPSQTAKENSSIDPVQAHPLKRKAQEVAQKESQT